MVDIHCAILQLFVQKIDLTLEIVLLVNVLVQPVSQVPLLITQTLYFSLEKCDIFLQLTYVLTRTFELQLKAAFSSIVCLVVKTLLQFQIALCFSKLVLVIRGILAQFFALNYMGFE